MRLRLQPDETITSYVARSLFINKHDSNFQWLKQVRSTRAGVVDVATEHGWPGVYGFNRFLHYHTPYPLMAFLKNDRDVSYSTWQYTEPWLYYYECDSAFCALCVKEDVETLGFSYWRRGFGPRGPSICVKHNTLLRKHCPFCQKPFGRYHSIDAMWKGCSGKYLYEAEAIRNEDAELLREATFYQSIMNSKFHLSMEVVVKCLLDKLEQDVGCSDLLGERFLAVRDRLRVISKKLLWDRTVSNAYYFDMNNKYLLECALNIYSDFDQLSSDVAKLSGAMRPIDSLWQAYQSGKTYSAQFVEEDYQYGVAIYSVNFSNTGRDDGIFRDRRNIVFQCCNGLRGYKYSPLLTLTVGDATLPVPKLSREDYLRFMSIRAA
ncbi:hypothetical protein [Pseudomonas farsensis]|uniref:TniQ protein n=1 Tax=Pseudomonas farsensis TaxID=2745492 RepID=A0ABU8QNQ6_9PSED